MKTRHIILILVVAVVTGIIITTFSGSGAYSHFEEAFNHPGRDFHIIGKLNTQKHWNTIVILITIILLFTCSISTVKNQKWFIGS